MKLLVLLAAMTLYHGPSAPARIEVETPAPPRLAIVDTRRVLVYELHVTSFARAPLELRRVEVLGTAGRPLATFADSALATLLEPIGGMQGQHGPGPMQPGEMQTTTHDPARLDPGRRVVVYLWVTLPNGPLMPVTLVNRLVFIPADSAPDPQRETEAEDTVAVPRDDAPVLDPPLPPGVWLAGDGPSNTSDHRRALLALAGRTYIAQRFAIDWVLVGPNGDTHRADATGNDSYWGFGQPVLAVADGEVSEIVDSIPDHPPHVLPGAVTLGNIAGNHILLRIAPRRYVLYAHLQHGSMQVRLHEHVHHGQVLAKLGDSGQATAPHLHLDVVDDNSVLGAEGIPWVLRSYDDLGPGSTFEMNTHPDVRRDHSLPGGDEVVRW